MKKKVNYDNLKVLVLNPEAIPAASKKFTELIYKACLEKKRTENKDKVI